ncbi:MAG: sigma 54-interacting transcriptional regulator, partial [Syntrophorhabdales bacterium]
RICGSLNIGEALWNCLLYIRRLIPADELVLTVYDPAQGSLEIVARADEKGFMTGSEMVPMPSHSRSELEHVQQYSRVRIKNDVWQDPIIKEVGLKLKWPDCSIIVARLIIQHKFIGSLIVRANGLGRYTEEHGELWSLVNEPVGIALANSRQYYQLLKLKENLADDNRYLHNELRRSIGAQVVGVNFGLKDVMEQVYRVAPLSSPVLLVGETGSGKEIIANAIHNLSPRGSGPLITVNCGAIPESLIDSELFGHEKGAFTGALTERRGRFERADKGTIFLDEVGELPLQAQVRLLRVLQEREIERVGGSHTIKVDIRVISATHRSLEKLVAEGAFRDDLYYRLKVYPIAIPPLRERRADIPALVEHFLAEGAIDRLLTYNWPGNVREVANVVERALIQSDGKQITFEELAGGAGNEGGASDVPRNGPALAVDTEPAPGKRLDGLRLDDMEARHIRQVMEMTGGKIEGKHGAATVLGMNPATLRYRMQKLGIPFGRKQGAAGEKRHA